MSKKLSASKKERLLKQADTIQGKIYELAQRVREAGLTPSTIFQSAGREVREIQNWIQSQ